MHGGDIYRNSIYFDFSVNINPLGVPSEVQWVLTEAALHSNKYPDIYHEKLIKNTAETFDVLEDDIVFGNGASEIIMAICHMFLPKSAMLIAPCFLGYERCIKGAVPSCDITYHHLKEEDGFALKEDIIDELLGKRPKLLFLTNPNNPNGLLTDKLLLRDIVKTCEKIGTTLVIDECFLALTGHQKDLSLVSSIRDYKSVIILRAFTKSFAIPGVRLGYAICSKKDIADGIKRHLPEWNLSIFAQMAGAECLKHLDFVDDAVDLINTERYYLTNSLKELGFTVFPSDVNFILFKSKELNLKEKLIEFGILIRDCSDFEGLDKGYYRIAVKLHNENEGLISALESIVNQ